MGCLRIEDVAIPSVQCVKVICESILGESRCVQSVVRYHPVSGILRVCVLVCTMTSRLDIILDITCEGILCLVASQSLFGKTALRSASHIRED